MASAARGGTLDSSRSDVVRWKAQLDERTIPQCRAAHGHSFDASQIPVIGWPGAVNSYCRCSAEPGEVTVPDVDSAVGALAVS
jgi:hypothetical protein